MVISTEKHSIISGIFSIAFVIVLQLFAAPVPIFRYIIPACILYLAVVLTYNAWYLQVRGTFTFWTWLRLGLFLASWIGIFFIVPSSGLRGLYLVVSLVIVYILERALGSIGERLLTNELLLTAFSISMLVMALAHYYIIPSVIYLIVVFAFMTVLTRASYELTPLSLRQQWLAAVTFGLVMTEVYVALNFLPFHYSVLAVALFSIYFCVWSLYYYASFKHLSLRKIQFHVGLAVCSVAVVAVLTRWSIIS
jgi:hypothetical protein